MVTRDGRLYTAESLADAADRHGIGATFIKAEVGRSIAEDVRRSELARRLTAGKALSAAAVGTGAALTMGPLAPFAVIPGAILGYHASALNDLYMEMAQTTDNVFRFGMFMDQLHKGFSEAEAAKHVRSTFYDYSDLSPFEKTWLREVFLFYAYMRKNQVQVFNALADNPSRVLGQFRMIANSQERAMGDQDPRMVLPRWLQSRYITLDEEQPFRTVREQYEYKNKYGRKIRYSPMIGAAEVVPMIGNMLAAMMHKDVGWYEGLAETLDFFGSATGPQIKGVYEITADRFIFSDRELRRIRIDSATVQAINDMGDPLGVVMFRTAAHPTGWMKLDIVSQEFYQGTRPDRTYYTVSSVTDQLMLYMILDLSQSLPGISLVEGRGKKMYRDFTEPVAKEFFLGEPITLPAGYDLMDLWAAAFSFPSVLTPTTTEAERRKIREANRKREAGK